MTSSIHWHALNILENDVIHWGNSNILNTSKEYRFSVTTEIYTFTNEMNQMKLCEDVPLVWGENILARTI